MYCDQFPEAFDEILWVVPDEHPKAQRHDLLKAPK